MATLGWWSSRPKIPPSPSASTDSESFVAGLKKLLRNFPYYLLVLTVGAGIALFSVLTTLLSQILCPWGYDDVSYEFIAAYILQYKKCIFDKQYFKCTIFSLRFCSIFSIILNALMVGFFISNLFCISICKFRIIWQSSCIKRTLLVNYKSIFALTASFNILCQPQLVKKERSSTPHVLQYM